MIDPKLLGRLAPEILDSLPIGLAMRDLEGRYVFVNRAWERFVGAKREDVIGKTVHDRAPKHEADAVVAEDKAALARGPGAPTELKDFGYGDKRYLLTRTVIADAKGKPIGVLVASVDTTERWRVERELATEQWRFEQVVRASQVGILDWDGITRTAYYSPRFKEILRFPADTDASKWPDYFEMVHPEERELVRGRFRAHVFGGGAPGTPDLHDPIQYRLRRADGSYVWIEGLGASVRDEKGYVTRFIAAITDISERRFQEEALRSAVRLREEVERMSRHDLKTPLNSVIAMSRLLRDGARLAREDDELLTSIERAGYRILNMVNLSLDLFRMEQGSYEFRPQPVDLAAVARRAAADLKAQAASKGVKVEVRSGAQSSVHGEELLCYSMLANLVKNAIEASPDEGTVTVTIEPDADAMVTKVHNAGAVPEAVRPRFFQKYTTSGKSGGIGLGAYSARLMARVQRGEVSLATSGAEGTTLTVRMARAEASKTSEESSSVPGEKGVSSVNPGASRRVLVVDDDEFNGLVLRRMLPSPPFEVEVAVNGRAALEAARRNWPDAVLLDLEMPVMDGYQAAAKLRELQREGGRKKCMIVAISSNDEDAIVRRAIDAGCDHYLVKPAARDALLRILAGEVKPGGLEPVVFDPALAAALPAFLLSRREILDRMPGALEHSRAELRQLAHKLAGSFAMYGFTWAAAECRALQRDAESGQAGDLARRIAAVRAHLDQVKIETR